MIDLSALFKDGEQRAGLSVTLPVLNGLEERLVLWEMATCGDRSRGGKSVGKTVSALSYSRYVDGQAQGGSVELHLYDDAY